MAPNAVRILGLFGSKHQPYREKTKSGAARRIAPHYRRQPHSHPATPSLAPRNRSSSRSTHRDSSRFHRQKGLWFR